MTSMEERRLSEAGYSLGWWAALFAFVLLPLMTLAVDVSRLLFLRTDLQTSVDAACEAAALAADTAHFNRTGVQRIDPDLALLLALQTFRASAHEAELVRYNASLTAVSVITPTDVACSAQASLVPLIPLSPELNVEVVTQSRMRFLQAEP